MTTLTLQPLVLQQAVNIVVVTPAPVNEQQGIVVALKDAYGFIERV